MKKMIFSLLSVSLIMIACSDDKKTEEGEKKDTSMSSATESKQERNKKVIMESMESFNKGDIDGTFKNAAASFTDYTDGSISPITNIDSLKGFFRMMTASIENYKGENFKYYTDGDYVLAVGDWSGTFKKDLMGIKASGKTVKFRDVDMFKFNEEGKIVEHSAVQNLGAVLMASGMMK